MQALGWVRTARWMVFIPDGEPAIDPPRTGDLPVRAGTPFSHDEQTLCIGYQRHPRIRGGAGRQRAAYQEGPASPLRDLWP